MITAEAQTVVVQQQVHTLNTRISPTRIGSVLSFVKKRRSPLVKAGSILPLITRTARQ